MAVAVLLFKGDAAKADEAALSLDEMDGRRERGVGDMVLSLHQEELRGITKDENG